MRNRRVMQLVRSLSPAGTQRVVTDICRQLSDRVESTVCCLGERGPWTAELEALHIPVVALGREAEFQPSLAKPIARLITAHGIDVLHCHHHSPYVYGLMASLMTDVKLVFTEHDRHDAGLSRKKQLVNPFLALLPAEICAASATVKRHMVAEGFPARRIRVVYDGIDPGSRPSGSQRVRASLGIAPEAFVVGTVGRLDSVTNLGVMLEVVAVLREKVKRTVIVIVGDGPERDTLHARAAALGVTDSVIFTGYRSDVRSLLAAFDVYLNCSRYEGVSRPILEAMASALPVVAAPVGGNLEVVVEHQTGYLVPARPRSIAETLASLAFDARLRRAMGDAARWRVIRKFSIARMADAYASIYLGDRNSAASDAHRTRPTRPTRYRWAEPLREPRSLRQAGGGAP